MKTLWIIETDKPFRGFTRASMTTKNDNETPNHVDYSGTEGGTNLTFEEYQKKVNKPLKIITDQELDVLNQIYIESLLTEWITITKERYEDLFEILPPVRFTPFGNNSEFFFMSEAQFDKIHSCFMKYENKYYKSDRKIDEKTNSIIQSIKKQFS